MLLWERTLQLVLKDSRSVCRCVSAEFLHVWADSGRGADCLILVLSYFCIPTPARCVVRNSRADDPACQQILKFLNFGCLGLWLAGQIPLLKQPDFSSRIVNPCQTRFERLC